ncbi:proteasome complex subunit Rpn13 ubiquitin receptor-domain-containing protein [Blakeslea trispora]|nr:proteasome complex subunit Rpn13 ubiquitin receptor-domain-containing protein [Blakeslea trispora]
MSLFAAPVTNHLVEFHAGKCIVEGSWIKPDTRKGLIYMDQSDDQLLHFYWKERKNQSTPEDDLIIFPDEAEFTKVTQCTTGRVYLLRFKTSNERHFYWMQSKSDENDQEVAEHVNELIHDPEANSKMPSDLDESASHAELLRLLNGVENQDPNITPENLLQFLNSMNGSHEDHEDEVMEEHEEMTQNEADVDVAPAAPAAAPADAPVAAVESNTSDNAKEQPSSEQLDQLRHILANVTPSSKERDELHLCLFLLTCLFRRAYLTD